MSNAWLWNNRALSDVKLHLVAEIPPEDVPATDGKLTAFRLLDATTQTEGESSDAVAQAEPSPEHCKEEEPELQQGALLLDLDAHGTVLASASEYFRTQLMKLQEKGVGAGSKLEIVESIHPDDLAAATAVLKLLYTVDAQSIPEDVEMLIRMLRLADRWNVPMGLEACLEQLALTKPEQLTVASLTSVTNILEDQVQPGAGQGLQPTYTALQALCQQRLMQLFGGDVQAVIQDAARRTEFCQLSFTAVKLWASLDELRVDSENSVAVLLTLWWIAHWGTPGTPVPFKKSGQVTMQQRKLTELVRMGQLSTSFLHGVLPQLPWFKAEPAKWNKFILTQVLHTSRGQLLPAHTRSQLPTAWLSKARKAAPPVLTVDWNLTATEIASLHTAAATGQALLDSPGLYWAGFSWHLRILLPSQKSPLWVGLTVKPAPGMAGWLDLPWITEARFQIKAKEASTSQLSKSQAFKFCEGGALQPGSCNGCPNFLGVPAADKPRTSSCPPATLLVDAKLQLQLALQAMA